MAGAQAAGGASGRTYTRHRCGRALVDLRDHPRACSATAWRSMVVSSDLEEVLGVSNRILVMAAGRQAGMCWITPRPMTSRSWNWRRHEGGGIDMNRFSKTRRSSSPAANKGHRLCRRRTLCRRRAQMSCWAPSIPRCDRRGRATERQRLGAAIGDRLRRDRQGGGAGALSGRATDTVRGRRCLGPERGHHHHCQGRGSDRARNGTTTMAVNTKGVFLCCQEAIAPHARSQRPWAA